MKMKKAIAAKKSSDKKNTCRSLPTNNGFISIKKPKTIGWDTLETRGLFLHGNQRGV